MKQKPERRISIRDFKTICRAIATYEDLDLLFENLVEVISQAFDVKGCSLLLYDEREKQLFRVSSYGISQEYLNKGPIFMDDKDSALVKCVPVFIEDMQNDPRVQYPKAAAREGIVSLLSFPIICREAVIGVIKLYHSKLWALHEEDLDLLCVMQRLLAFVIDHNGLKNFLEQVKTAVESLPHRMLDGP
ncbi:MAG: GAF domain-containing protein [Desulfobacterales bacterium]|jgi:signal transduction protein with GAF and PtsI domain